MDRFEPKIKKLFAFYSQHENKYGLLEKLGGWNFVEHSKANDLIKDVNYPTNMLYYAALNAAGQLYNTIMTFGIITNLNAQVRLLRFANITPSFLE